MITESGFINAFVNLYVSDLDSKMKLTFNM